MKIKRLVSLAQVLIFIVMIAMALSSGRHGPVTMGIALLSVVGLLITAWAAFQERRA